jgi:hypothetical protein
MLARAEAMLTMATTEMTAMTAMTTTIWSSVKPASWRRSVCLFCLCIEASNISHLLLHAA